MKIKHKLRSNSIFIKDMMLKKVFLLVFTTFLVLSQTSCKDVSATNKLSNNADEDLTIVVYPKVQGLENVKGFEESSVFDLKINNQDAFVYRSFEIKDEHEHVKQLKSIYDLKIWLHGMAAKNYLHYYLVWISRQH